MVNLYQAELRAADFYLAVLREAGALYDQGGEALKRGLALSREEWVNIESRQTWAESHFDDNEQVTKLCSDFPEAAPRLLDLQQHPRERIRWLEIALRAAQVLEDQPAVGRHLNCLGLAYSHLGEAIRAIKLFQSSLEILRQANDRRAEGEVLSNIGHAYANLGEPSLAVEFCEQALTIAREQGDSRNEGIALCNMGQSYYQRREFHRALEFYEESLKITSRIGYLHGENIILNHLGKTYAILNKPEEAIRFYERALHIAHEIGDRHGERNALGNLGQAYHLLNEVDHAIELYLTALSIAREIGDPLVEAELLNNLGDAHLDADNPSQAVSYYEQRLKITRELGRRRGASVEHLFHEWTLRRVVDSIDEKQSAKAGRVRPQKITWLHISDIHLRGSDFHQYDENIVIEALLEDIDDRIKKDKVTPDFIAVTGDLAFSGKSFQYNSVSVFLDRLLSVTGLSRQRVFVVPGNHDVDRDMITRGAIAIGKELTDRQVTNTILASPADRRLLFARFKGYAEFFNEYFKGHRVFDDDERYFYVQSLDIGNRRLAILGLNSAWLAASDDDEILKLVIGDRQTRTALNAAKDLSADIQIALLHHPDDWIRAFDQSDSMALLINKCDFILHGHLHKPATTQRSNPDGSAVIIAGGACYETRTYPNSYNFVQLDLESSVGTIYFREYVDEQGGFWAKGVRLYKNAPDGRYEFPLPREKG